MLSEGHVPIQLTFGAGDVGLKSRRLRAIREAAVKAGFYYPDQLSFTPKFFERFLWECGATKTKLPHESKVRIFAGNFTDEEIKEITRAVLSFTPMLRNHLLVRSDECSAGVGFSHTGPATMDYNLSHEKAGVDKIEPMLPFILAHMKKILAQDYSRNMLALRSRQNLSENSGVMLMPLYGEHRDGLVAPVLSFNIMGSAEGQKICSVGAGFGGANKRYAEFTAARLIDNFIFESLDPLDLRGWDAVSIHNSRVISDNWSPNLGPVMRYYPLEQANGTSLENLVNNFFAIAGPHYIEVIRTDWIRPTYILVQASPFSNQKLEPPVPSPGSLVINTTHAVGTKIANADRVHYLPSAGEVAAIPQMKFNSANSGYIAIVRARSATIFDENFSPADFSNAAGIVLVINEMEYSFASHLGGGYKELGIPIIAIRYLDGDLKSSLEANPDQPLNCVIFADELNGRGSLEVKR